MLESGTTLRTSPKVLDRLADVLMLDPHERSRLFELAIPELRAAGLRAGTLDAFDGFAVVRAAAKRLWAATTEVAVLETVAEHVAAIIGDADLVFYSRRLGQGEWEWPYVLDRGLGKRNRELFDASVAHLTPAEIDHFLLFPRLSQPGDVGTSDAFTAPAVRAAYLEYFCTPALDLGSFLCVRVRSRRGTIGGVSVKHRGTHTYTDDQRVMLSALGDLASIALT
jgi:GAF domain-containing protein